MDLLTSLTTAARRIETPCAAGQMVWHAWNEGAGAPLVLLHGGNGSWRHWVRQVPAFAATRCVIAADLPGLGDSDAAPEPGDPPTIAQVVTAGLRAILPDTSRMDLVGFSFGSNIAGHVAAELGAALRSLTIVGAGALGVARGETPLMKIRDKQGEERVAAHRHNLASLMIKDPARIDALALEIQEWNTVHARTRSRGFATTGMLRDALVRSPAPLGAIWGEADQVAVPHMAERLDALRSARPDAAIELISGAGHWVMYEAPEAFNAALSRLLARAV
jgi:pimeloyl-ACP methyl ester carboxylesterase